MPATTPQCPPATKPHLPGASSSASGPPPRRIASGRSTRAGLVMETATGWVAVPAGRDAVHVSDFKAALRVVEEVTP